MKTYHKKDVLTILNLDEAEKYVGEEGYFSDRCYAELGLWEYGRLVELLKDETVESVFYAANEDGDEINYFGYFGLFIPAEKVKETATTTEFRPFANAEEFERVTGYKAGDLVTLYIKDRDMFYQGIYLAKSTGNGTDYITVGTHTLQLNAEAEMERHNIIYKNCDVSIWFPFGIIEG